MKKFLSLCLILALCLSLVACDQSDKVKLEITNDAMAPTFSVGDTVIYEYVDPATLRVGDIIAFWGVEDGQRLVQLRRIENIYDLGENLMFETVCDNTAHTAKVQVHETNVLGRYVRTLVFGFF